MKKRAGWCFAADRSSGLQGHLHAVVLSAGFRSLLTLLIPEGQPPDSIAESNSAHRGIVSILAHSSPIAIPRRAVLFPDSDLPLPDGVPAIWRAILPE